MIEAQSPDMICSILLLDADGVHVRHGAAPGLPEEFNRAIDGQPIGPRAGSCGTAAYRREAVIVEDVATDPLWADYRAVALTHGLRACWSTPIFDATRRVLGTFAIYFRQPGRPNAEHLRPIEVATHIAAIAINRAQNVAALRESEERLRQISDNLPGGMIYQVVREPDGRMRFLHLSAGIVQLNGVAPEAVLADPLALYGQIHPEDAPRVAAAEAESLRTMSVFSVEARLRRADGALRWMLLTSMPRLLPDGRVLWDGIELDITARKQVEEERQKFVMLADSSSEFIGMCDLDLQPLYVNPAGVRLVGLADMAAACRVKVQDYFFPEDQRFIGEEFFPRVLREGHGDMEIRLRHFQTGEPIWMFYYLFRVRDATGRAVGWATVSRDITARKQAEEKIKAQIAELQRWHDVTLGREDRVIALKREVNELLRAAGKPARYASVEPAKDEPGN